MPLTQIILTLLIPVVVCWSFISSVLFFAFHPALEKSIAGLTFQGFIPSHRNEITAGLASYVANSIESIGARLFDGKMVIDVLRPDIEAQVDLFLKEKLKEAFPLMHQMMGEKTLAKFRIVFLEEVENILPALIQKQGSGLLSKFELEKMVAAQLNTIALTDIEKAVAQSGGYLKRIKLLAAGSGLLIGLLQLTIELVFH
jgi:uncharacterized membrane protein YheB (UPF0754 family)